MRIYTNIRLEAVKLQAFIVVGLIHLASGVFFRIRNKH